MVILSLFPLEILELRPTIGGNTKYGVFGVLWMSSTRSSRKLLYFIQIAPPEKSMCTCSLCCQALPNQAVHTHIGRWQQIMNDSTAN